MSPILLLFCGLLAPLCVNGVIGKGVSYSTSPWVTGKGDIPNMKTKGRGAGIAHPVPVKFLTTMTRLGHLDLALIINATDAISESMGISNLTNHTYPNPEDIIHGAVAVYGYVFEFIFDKGIDVIEEVSYRKDNTPMWEEHETFKTQKDYTVVRQFVNDMVKNFSQETYHVVDNNCLHFAKAFATFLGGKDAQKYEDQRHWLQENKFLGQVLQFALKTKYAMDHGQTPAEITPDSSSALPPPAGYVPPSGAPLPPPPGAVKH